jgi:hypothetical protein
MKTFLIEETEKTPRITFHCGVLRICGKSITSDAGKFYFPVIENLIELIEKKQIRKIIVNLEFINASSYRELEKIFRIFEISGLGQIDYYYNKKDLIWKVQGEQIKLDFEILNLIEI